MPEKMQVPNPAAPFIKKCAKEILANHQSMTVNELKTYISKTYGYPFTQGQYAGALKTLIDEPGYKIIQRGVYVYEPQTNQMNTYSSIRDDINLILDKCLIDLRKLGIVDLLQISDPELADIQLLKQVIQKIEALRIH